MTGKNIHQRMHDAMNDVDYIQKEKKSGMQYTIVSHDAVTAKVRPVLVKHGIIYYPVALSHSQDGNRTQVALTVRFANIDKPDDFIDVPGLGYGIDAQDKGPGKAISYAVKYCLLKALGLETGDDPDQDQDVRHEPTKKNAPTVPMVSPPSESATPALWKAYAREMIECASGVPSQQRLAEIIKANSVGMEALRKASPAAYEWLDQRIAEISDQLRVAA